ncbi:hypothetical protein RchiOBHm_Chr4g0394311 [Rosa chinensis]|uniref:EXS domain-containing protein n=1 Tax=Rosa chinensis TaxID=74649 RepID=A0A2P6QR76_ROSCH|nr:hypothetical protein RchiOBHm_Chr4g0394311 [Rosa chinensis]
MDLQPSSGAQVSKADAKVGDVSQDCETLPKSENMDLQPSSTVQESEAEANISESFGREGSVSLRCTCITKTPVNMAENQNLEDKACSRVELKVSETEMGDILNASKVSNQQASASYLKAVKRSYFISSNKHFANNDKKKATKLLRPQQHKESHMVTFFVGLFTGCFVSLFNCNLFMYGCNLCMWKSTRINCNFIFEFQLSTALKYRDAFLICTTFMTAVVGAMVVHLILRANNFLPSQVDAIPEFILLFSIALLICPLDIFYRPTCYCFIRVIRNIVCSPLYKIPLLRHMESTACYFIAGSFRTHQYKTCKSRRLFKELAYVISFLPYYGRAMQVTLPKFLCRLIHGGSRTRITYANQQNHLWFSIVVVPSVVATVYQLYWDFVKDWGLFNPNSKNLWLRDELILKNKRTYYFSLALNAVLRVAWVETVMGFHNISYVELENEHLNNVGKFRAVKTVPLPFRDADSDG